MIDPDFTIKHEVEKNDFGRFSIEPLDQGFGHTLGNSLRRVLLTSLKGAAVTKVKIDGVKHPFSTLPGLKEDIIQLLLNVKKIRFKLNSDKPITVTLNSKGSGKIYAKQLETKEAEVINKDLYLGELTGSKAKLNMELTVEQGYGYVTADEHDKEKELEAIVVDSLFSP